jgi:hypothetical protein
VIPLDAAAHIFGFPGDEQDMATYMARRFGWNRPEHYKPDEDGVLPWVKMTRKVKLAIEKYEVRRLRGPGEPIPAEEAAEAPDMMGVNVDPPPARRTVVGRRRGKPRKRVLRPRQLATASGPLHQSLTEPSTETPDE